MKRNVINLVTIVLIAVNVAGCSVVRIIETQVGIGVKKTTETETRQTDRLRRKDVQMRFDATGNELSFRLQYQPYYEVEKRETTKYTPLDEVFTLSSLVGLAELVAFVGVAIDGLTGGIP